MTDRSILDKLGQLAKDDDDVAADPRWERRARGTATPEEEAELRRLARGSSAGSAMIQGTEPLGDAALDAMTDALMRDVTVARAPAEADAPRPGAVIPLHRKRRRVTGIVAGALALAAALAIFVRSPATAPVPDFDLVVSHGELDQRALPRGASTPRFGPGAQVELILRPQAPVHGKVEVRGALVRGGETRDFRPPVEMSPNGAARIEGTRETVFPGVPDGEWEIWLAVGRPDALPARLPADRPADPSAARILHAKVLLTPDRR